MPEIKNKYRSYYDEINTEFIGQLVQHLNGLSLCIRDLGQHRSEVIHLVNKSL